MDKASLWHLSFVDGLSAWPPLVVVSPFVGSFLGCLAMRLPQGRPVLLGRSECENCRTPIAPRDLVPLASWLMLRGRCRHCNAPLGLFYPMTEIAALLVVLWAMTMTTGQLLVATCVFGWQLVALAFADAKSGLLPDPLTACLALSGLAATALLMPADIAGHLIGAVAGFLVLALVATAYRAWRKRDGLGLGDAKLLGGLGAWLSWEALPTVILYASLSALAYVLARRLAGKPVHLQDRISFGPFLAFGGWLIWLYGPLMPG